MKHLPTSDFLRDLARRVDADYDRGRLECIADVLDDMDAAVLAGVERAVLPAPGSTMGLSGATITHRPDIAYAETARQAAAQGESGVLPAQRAAGALAPVAGPSTHVIPGNAGTVHAPAPLHAAEPARIGTETR